MSLLWIIQNSHHYKHTASASLKCEANLQTRSTWHDDSCAYTGMQCLCNVATACLQAKTAAHRVGQVTKFAELVAMLQPQHLKSIRYNHALDLVIRWRDAFKAL